MDHYKTNPYDADVPFGNSIFQIVNFTDGKESPERRYRHCMLQLSQKYNALKICEFRRNRLNVDIDEIKYKLQSSDGFESRRLEIDIAEKEHFLSVEEKLINDCLVEVETYHMILEELQTFTRKKFEEAEQLYWQKRLLDDARVEMLSTGSVSVGTIKGIENTGLNIGRNIEGKLVYGIREPENTLLIDTEIKEVE